MVKAIVFKTIMCVRKQTLLELPLKYGFSVGSLGLSLQALLSVVGSIPISFTCEGVAQLVEQQVARMLMLLEPTDKIELIWGSPLEKHLQAQCRKVLKL